MKNAVKIKPERSPRLSEVLTSDYYICIAWTWSSLKIVTYTTFKSLATYDAIHKNLLHMISSKIYGPSHPLSLSAAGSSHVAALVSNHKGVFQNLCAQQRSYCATYAGQPSMIPGKTSLTKHHRCPQVIRTPKTASDRDAQMSDAQISTMSISLRFLEGESPAGAMDLA
uniref:Uncharacterized protein n=1 Tax=Cannabis sativa TaxID=3483 RepID=A0A803QSW6_CANSA